jgi:hypothetical protein
LATSRRLSVYQAAQELGITPDAVRGRIKRETIEFVKEGGRVWVVLADDHSDTNRDQDTDQHTDQHTDQQQSEAEQEDRYTRSLEEQVTYLRGELSQEREANREMRRLLAGLIERVPELEAAQEVTPEEPEDHHEPEERPEASEPGPGVPGAQEGARRPWWRRMFGG